MAKADGILTENQMPVKPRSIITQGVLKVQKCHCEEPCSGDEAISSQVICC